MRLHGCSILEGLTSISILVSNPPYSKDLLNSIFCKVFFAYAVVTRDSAVLFIDESQVDDSVKAHLGQSVSIQPYRAFLPYLKQLAADSFVKKEEVSVHILLDPCALSDPLQPVLLGNKTSLAVVEALGEVSCFDGTSCHFST